MTRAPFTKCLSSANPIANRNIFALGKVAGTRKMSVLPTTSSLVLALLFMIVVPGALAANGNPFSVDQALNLSTEQQASAMQPAVPAPTVPATHLAPAAEIPPLFPQRLDYSANLNSDVFGANLFTGAFARQGATQFNPDYAIAMGDNIHVRLWGAFEYDASLSVDPKGNIFLPHVGPVQVLGVRNQDLQGLVESAIGKVFRTNVYAYASLAAAQPVRVFVGGFVHRPGLYSGTSMDSLLHYLDQAGGIDPERGSFLNVQVKRGSQIRASVSLYDFLLEGRMPLTQLADGDVIFVAPRQHTLKVNGLTENARRFEFGGATHAMADLVKVAKPNAQATHVRVVRNTGMLKNTEYYPLADAAQVVLQNGDELEFTADKKLGSITVRVEGEHESAQEYVLRDGVKLGDLIGQIRLSGRSDAASLQLFRASVKKRQKQMLHTSLKSLEAAALTARSGTVEEARLRKDEAELILQWVERAKQIEPAGQVLIAQAANRDDLTLENGDILRIPTKDGLVLVSGEVLFPNAIAFDAALGLDDYIRRSGGYTQSADASRVIVAHRDGSFDEAGGGGFFGSNGGGAAIRAGDEVLVLPKVDVKSRQFWKELTQIVYQIAVSAKIVFKL